MNSDSCRQCSGVILALAIGGFGACRDSTPIGSVECIGERIQCGLPENQPAQSAVVLDTPHEEVSSTGLDTLMPVWSGQPFENAPEQQLKLLVDADAALWSVSTRDGRVTLAKLDREGASVEEHTIEPPQGSRNPDGLRAVWMTMSPTGANSSATITLQWSRGCDGRAGEPADCVFNELLVFEALDREPHRVNLGFQSLQVLANDSGVWFVDNNTPHVDKLDLSAKLIWRQTGLIHLQAPDTWWNLSAALRPSDELSVLVWAQYAPPISGLDLWKLNASGSIKTRQAIGWSGVDPLYAIDAHGRDVIVGASVDGDLTLLRVLSNGASESQLIVREEYLALRRNGFALDSEGAAYVASVAGGREPMQWRELLCQLPDSGTTRCFTLGELSASAAYTSLIDELVVPEPGVVYVHSGSALRRYELPPAAP
jgi:hypothetical protein